MTSLRCSLCHAQIEGSYLKKDGKAYCSKHKDQLLEKCTKCLKPIKDRYLKVGNGEMYHPDCLCCEVCGKAFQDSKFTIFNGKRIHPTCLRCCVPGCEATLDINGFRQEEGKPYCQKHYDEKFTKKCEFCGNYLRKEFILVGVADKPGSKTQKKRACHECFKCVQCGMSLEKQKFFVHEGDFFCEKDYQTKVSPKCMVCSKYVESFIQHESGEVYCENDYHANPVCFSCARLVFGTRKHALDLPDGRVICERCNQDAVWKSEDAAAPFRKAKQFLADVLGIADKEIDSVSLRFVERSDVAALRGEHSRSVHETQVTDKKSYTMGTTIIVEETENDEIVSRQVEGINLLSGQTAMQLTSTLVHELMHVYLFSRRFGKLDPLVEEGICELAAFLWLDKFAPEGMERSMRLNQRLFNSSKVYKAGLAASQKRFKELNGDKDVKAVFQKILNEVKELRTFR
mmetsp:Transcript_2542/g.8343  ORF Transcript_2542/g.8343 Transcript_2542/m.8343 type:complete len:457 (-) Transcript_2542:71-1441(-)